MPLCVWVLARGTLCVRTARKEASGIMELRRGASVSGKSWGMLVWGIPELCPVTPVCPPTLQVDKR